MFEDFCMKWEDDLKFMILFVWPSSFTVLLFEETILYSCVLVVEIFYLRMDRVISG